MRDGEDEQRGESKAQQHQPPGRLVGLLLARDEFEQEAQRRKAQCLRAWAA